MKNIPAILKKLLNIGILTAVVIAPTQYAIEVTNKVYLSAVDPLIWGVFSLFAVCAVMRIIRPARPSLFGALFLLMVALSAIRASNRMSAMKELFQAAEYFIIAYMLFGYFFSDIKRRMIAVYVFAGIGTLIVLISLIQYLRPTVQYLAVAGTFGNRNVLGGYLALLLPLMTGLMIYDKNRYRLVWYALTIAAGLFVCLSGGAMLSIMLALTVVAMLKGKLVPVGFAAILLLAMCFVVPHLPRDNAAVLRESIRLFDDDGNVSRRYTEWQASGTMIEENQLLGVGAGNYQENIGMYYGILPDPIGPTEPDTQNLYLVTASSIGWLGLAALIGLLCQAAVSAVRRHASAATGFDSGLMAGVLGSIIAFAIAALWSPLLVRGISIPLVFILALASQRASKTLDG